MFLAINKIVSRSILIALNIEYHYYIPDFKGEVGDIVRAIKCVKKAELY